MAKSVTFLTSLICTENPSRNDDTESSNGYFSVLKDQTPEQGGVVVRLYLGAGVENLQIQLPAVNGQALMVQRV